MAVIMKIRNRLGIVIVAVIMLSIVGFLLQDAFNSNTSVFRYSANQLGSVNGNEVDRMDYDNRVERAMANMRQQMQGNLDEQMQGNIRDQVWNQYVDEVLLKDKYRRLGLEISDEEMKDQLVGTNPHPYVKRAFSDPKTGQFNSAQVVDFVKRLETNEDTSSGTQWDNFLKSIKEDRMKVKYNALVKKAMYVPSWQATENYSLTSSTVDFEYVYVPYADVADADVTVSDSEIKDYINAHKAKYKRDESRSIEYVSFDVVATPQDTMRTRDKLAELLPGLKSSKDDSSFLHINSDIPLDMNYYGKDELKGMMKDTIWTLGTDSNNVIGPYYDTEDASFKYAKLVNRRMIPDSVRASHIFFSIASAKTREDVAAIRAKADSILKVINSGAGDFASIAMQNSDDMSTKMMGGDWGWIKPHTKNESINDALFFRHKEGDTFMMGVDEQNTGNSGFHIIRITEAKPTKDAVQVGYLSRRVTASPETGSAQFNKADKFQSENHDAQKFKEAGKENNIKPVENIQKNAYFIPGLGSAREVVKWIYNAKANEVSNVFSLEDKYVVVLVTQIQEEGVATVESVRGEVEAELKKEKKAEKLKEKMQGADLNTVAAATGKQVATASGLSASNTAIAGVGDEPKVVGKALGLNSGDFATGVAGDNGVFAIKVGNKNVPNLTDVTMQKKTLTQSSESRIEYNLSDAVRKSAEVVDNRYKFY